MVDDVIAATLAKPAQFVVLLLVPSSLGAVLPDGIRCSSPTPPRSWAMLAAFIASRLVDAVYQTLVVLWPRSTLASTTRSCPS